MITTIVSERKDGAPDVTFVTEFNTYMMVEVGPDRVSFHTTIKKPGTEQMIVHGYDASSPQVNWSKAAIRHLSIILADLGLCSVSEIVGNTDELDEIEQNKLESPA